MLVAIGCDHAALGFKNNILQYLSEINFQYLDFGCFSEETTDYPIYGEKVANSIISNQCHAGLLFCGTGVGISLAANKVKGIRAVVCSDVYTAKLSKAHNNTNILALGARVVGLELAKMIIETWLNTTFLAGRHSKRLEQITAIENRN